MKRPAAGPSQSRKKQVVGRTVKDMLDGTIEIHEQYDSSNFCNAKLPDCMDDIDTSFLTGSTPSPKSNDANVVVLSDSDERSGIAIAEANEVDNLLHRAFDRSFEESGMYDVVYNIETGEEECSGKRDRAKARVHMIMDQREKAHQLTNALIRKRESHA